MTESGAPTRSKIRLRRWWSGVALAALVLVAGGLVTAYVIRDRGSSAPERDAVSRPSRPQPPPAPSAPAGSTACGDRPASTAPAPSGRDDTAALNAFFASTPNDSCVALVRDTYQVNGTVLISGKSGLALHGNGATLAAQTQADRNRRHVVIAKSSNVTVKGLRVRGANQEHLGSQWELEAQHGFEIAGQSRDIRLVDVRVDEVYGDAVYIGGDAVRVLVQGGSFSNTGRQGVVVSAARDVILDGFTLRNAGRFCIDLEPNVPRLAVEQVTIRNSNSTCPKGWLIFNDTVVRGVYTSNNMYNGSRMPEGRLVPGIYPKRSHPI